MISCESYNLHILLKTLIASLEYYKKSYQCTNHIGLQFMRELNLKYCHFEDNEVSMVIPVEWLLLLLKDTKSMNL